MAYILSEKDRNCFFCQKLRESARDAENYVVYRGKEAFASVFDLSALAEWGRSIGTVVQLLAAQFGGLWLWVVVVAAAAVVLWRRGCRLRGSGLFAAGLLLASAGYVVLIDKAAPFEADRYYVVIYAAVVLAVAVVLARLAPIFE